MNSASLRKCRFRKFSCVLQNFVNCGWAQHETRVMRKTDDQEDTYATIQGQKTRPHLSPQPLSQLLAVAMQLVVAAIVLTVYSKCEENDSANTR